MTLGDLELLEVDLQADSVELEIFDLVSIVGLKSDLDFVEYNFVELEVTDLVQGKPVLDPGCNDLVLDCVVCLSELGMSGLGSG